MPTPTKTRAFAGYLSFFRGKVRVSRFTQKPFGSKNVVKPTLDMKQQVFPRNKLRKKTNKQQQKKTTIHAVNKWVKQLGLIVIEFLPNLRDFRYVGWTRREIPTTFQSVTGLEKPARILSGTLTSRANNTFPLK